MDAANLSGYQITEQLYAGTRTIVYRAIRTSDKYPVVIKLLRNEYPKFNELVGFRNQYTIAKNLDFPSIIKPLSLEAYRNSYAVVMEDFGGISLSTYLKTATDQNQSSNSLSLTEFLNLALQLTDILNYLYQNRVIHKDIKPANILINPETKQVKLIDFSIASLLPRETQEIQNPNILEGTLAYLSPEQTGRMNRGIDYRSDFYSLGVTFYELLAGKLPFLSNDPMELVHFHLAKQPMLIHQFKPEIPLVLSEIVSKLMAKNAENRYQSALGLKHDLEICLAQLQKTGKIEYFDIGKRDITDRFIIPEKLYGRETEVETLLQAFERVSTGSTEMMLVAGFSGIGKTAVINEVNKPIVRQRGYFIKGKYDQFQRNIPFSAFVQAFRDLMGQLLSESDAELQLWKTQIMTAVGDNGQVLIDVIPELERIISKQSPAPELSGSAAQNRFNLLMQKFVQVFAKTEHPLVMFLDDLQWADSASLKLLQLLMTETGHLLILGAYRDNEVSSIHPFILTIDEIIKTGIVVNTITLEPLSLVDINQLMSDTLNCDRTIAQPLTKLVYQKTQGNPFFATQFLKALHEDKQITFDWEAHHWQCDIAQVKALAITDDVVEFMALQLQKLPVQTQDGLKLAACIGAQFDLNTLAIVSDRVPEDMAAMLWKALQEGLIIPNTEIYKFFIQSGSASVSDAVANPTYRFLHDRVQQAAYSLIAEGKEQKTHLDIGRILLNNTPKKQLEKNIFAIVNHWNQAIDLIVVNQFDRMELVYLNLMAGRRAKNAIAYESAMGYLKTGILILPSTIWETHYTLALELYNLAAEIAYLSADFLLMDRWLDVVFEQARTILDRIGAYQTKILAYTAQTQQQEVIQITIKVLKDLEIPCLEKPNGIEVEQEFTIIQAKLANQTVEALVQLPEMKEPQWLAAIQILQAAIPTVYQVNAELFKIMVFKLIELSLEYGNTSFTSFGYACYGLLLCDGEQIEAGHKFGHLASTLAEKFAARSVQVKTLYCVNVYINVWNNHILDVIYQLQETYKLGIEQGEIEFAGYAIFHHSYCSYISGFTLSLLKSQIIDRITLLQKSKQDSAAYWTQCYLESICILLQESPTQVLDSKSKFLMILDGMHNKSDFHGLFHAYLNQTILFYLLEDIDASKESLEFARKYLYTVAGSILVATFTFYDSLVKIRSYVDANMSERSVILEMLTTNESKMHNWAFHAPSNYQNKYDLLKAEKCRILGKSYEAMDLYDRAIALAKENQFVNEEALANEFAAKFYLNWGKEKVAQAYMIESYYCYARWGAKAKVADLETRYPQLLQPILQSPKTSFDPLETLSNVTHSSTQVDHSTSISDALDFGSVLKAAQALSSIIQLDELLQQLTQIILQNSGGDKCVLVLPLDETWQVRAISTPETTELCSEFVDGHLNIPIKLIQYVKRTQTVVVVDNLQTDLPIIDDYLNQHQPKSILCLPILDRGHLAGILYLKNEMTAGVFTRDRLTVINFLCTQAAISLENARLYAECKASEKSLQETNNLLNSFLEAMPDYFFAKDLQCRYMIMNSNVGKFFNQSINEIIGKTDADFMLPEIAEEIMRIDREVITQGITKRIEEIAQVDGVNNTYLSVKTPLRDPQGNIIGLIGLSQNITDRKQAEVIITEKSQELSQALQNLQHTQLQMIQSEKMSALGNLVAGVAHEINNPVGFISGNLHETQQTVQDLVEHLNLYRDRASETEIADHAVDIDIDYIIEDLPKMIDSMKLGCDRIKGISTSLRTFSRADTDNPVACNIHDGIDSTLMILKHRLKASESRPEIAVIKDYGNLPKVECYAGQLNQVFMNLLANAIDALDESNQGMSYKDISNKIVIKTELSTDCKQVIIRIKDNGFGMSQQVRDKIFDQLFTTKGVGKGTGLGLAIAHQIVVEKHRGAIDVNSTRGQGTEFAIALPLGSFMSI
jgi:PAS domain S-box-containing protein